MRSRHFDLKRSVGLREKRYLNTLNIKMFKKPKRNFRGRKAQPSISDEDEENKEEAMEIDMAHIPKSQPTLALAAKKSDKKKDKKKSKGSVLSFGPDEDEEEQEIFKVKKSSHSRRIAKQLKKESRKEKEEHEKREQEEKEAKAQAVVKASNKGESSESDGSGTPNGSVPDFDLGGGADSEEEEQKPGPLHKFHSVLKGGAIPDAHMIHLARKKRQMAREMGDFIPLEDTVKVETTKSRLIREDENDLSDEGEDDRLSLSVNHREQHLRNIQTTILAAEEEKQSDGSDHEHEREWEEQQIRKAVNVPQIRPSNGNEEQYYNNYQQYLYSQGSNIFNPNGPSLSPNSKVTSDLSKLKMAPHKPGTTDLQNITIEAVKKRLQERLDSMVSVHRTHKLEKDDIESRLETCESDIDNNQGSRGNLEEQYKFFQEMRGYVRDLVECLNEKVPQVDYLDRCLMTILKQRTERLVKRRQEDIKDQSTEFSVGKAAMAPNLMDPSLGQDSEKQRRVAEREARRSRRRRAREAKGIRDHQEGMSTDEEESNSETTRFLTEKERLIHDSRTIFEDVMEDFVELRHIKRRFEEWKYKHGESYDEAYIGLCIPKLVTPFVKLRLIEWNPLEVDCGNFEEAGWYESLMFYGFREGQTPSRADSDIKLMPSLIEKVLLPKLTALVEGVWDPMSTGQTARLVRVARKLVDDYPTVNAEAKNTRTFLKAVATRLRKTLDDDVFMPLYPKQILEAKTQGPYQFFQRQFWNCVKLLGNMLQWHGLLSDPLLRELGLDGLLNRYMVLALMNSPVNGESVRKCQVITSTFPKSWFTDLETDSTIPQLQNLCRYLVYATEQLPHIVMSKQDAKECLRQIMKMLVNIHAMDHAVAVGNKFSVKM